MSEATVPSPSAAPSPAPVVTTNKTKSTKSGTGTTSNSSSTNRRKGRGGGGGRSRTVIPATDKSAVKFAGICQKALKGWVITWHADNKHLMGKQYHAFLSHLLVACGHVSMEVSISMKQMEAVTILYFRPVLPAAYATANETDKAYYDDILKLDMKKAAENYRTFQQDWYCMFNRIIGQLGPMMVQQLQRSKAWEELERDSDPAELMKLYRRSVSMVVTRPMSPMCLSPQSRNYLPGSRGHKLLQSMMSKSGLTLMCSVILSNCHLIPRCSQCSLSSGNTWLIYLMNTILTALT